MLRPQVRRVAPGASTRLLTNILNRNQTPPPVDRGATIRRWDSSRAKGEKRRRGLSSEARDGSRGFSIRAGQSAKRKDDKGEQGIFMKILISWFDTFISRNVTHIYSRSIFASCSCRHGKESRAARDRCAEKEMRNNSFSFAKERCTIENFSPRKGSIFDTK